MTSSAVSFSAFDPFASWRGPDLVSCDAPVPIAFPNGMLPPLIDLRNNRDASFLSRSKKARAMDRVDGMPIWACSARIAHLLIKRGKGDRHACVFSHKHIQELLHRSGKIRGTCGTLYSIQHIRVCLRQLEDFGLVRWRRLMPGDYFPSRSMNVDGGGDVVKVGACVYFINMAALLGDGRLWTARTRRPGKGGRPPKARPDPIVEAEELAGALEEFHALAAPPVDDVEQLAPEIPEALEAPPEASAAELEAAAPSSEEVIIHDLEEVIIHDHCSLPASQDVNFDPERVGASGARGLAAANEAGATRPREIRAPRGLAAANEASETPPEAKGSHASHDDERGAYAPSARREREHDPSHGDRETEAPRRVRSSEQRPVHPNGRGLFIVDPDGVEHSLADVVREMPDWFRAIGRRGAPAPLSIRRLAPPAPAPRDVPPDWHDDDDTHDHET